MRGKARFEVRKGLGHNWHYVLIASNGAVLCTSENYDRPGKARKGAEAARRAARAASLGVTVAS